MMYKNSEGYASPTEGEALAHIIHEERLRRRAERRKTMKFTRVWHNPEPYVPDRKKKGANKRD